MNGSEVKALFDTKWGMWRRFISANPLTGSWASFGVGLAVGFVLSIIL